MTWQVIVSIIAIVLCVFILLINPKTHYKGLFKKQFDIFYDVRKEKKKICWFDLVSFFACPLGLSVAIVFGLKIVLATDSIGILLTIFSIFFSIIFSAFSFLSNISTNKKIKKEVAEETTIALFTESELSMFEIVALLIDYFLSDAVSNGVYISEWIMVSLSFLSIFIAFLNLTLLLIVVKRIFMLRLFSNQSTDDQND